MSRIDDLIAEHCPDGVPRLRLGSLGRRNKGTPMTAERMKSLAAANGPIRIFAGGQTIADVAEGVVPEDHIVRHTSIIVKSRGHIDFAFYEKPFTHKAELWSYTLDDKRIEQKFAYYFLVNNVDYFRKLARATSVKLPQLSVSDTDNFEIPVPPLEVQREIVRILDNFTQLEAELEAELEARRKQYAYYRDSLLTFGPPPHTRWATLGEVATRVSSGATPSSTRSDYYDGDIPWLRTQDVDFNLVHATSATITKLGFENSSVQWVPIDTVVVAMYGATAGKSALTAIPLTTNQACCNIECDPKIVNHRFVFYWLMAKYAELKSLGQGSQSNLNASTVKAFEIPVPPLEEQQRIVDILDKFDALVNDISVGLPAELAARRKQYEYYRDRLLTFPEKAA